MTDWYGACLKEVEEFLDLYQDADEVTVSIDSDLVAALIGVLNGALINHAAAKHALSAAATFRLLGNHP